MAANAVSGASEIQFAIGSGPQTVALSGAPLPPITGPVTIDGTTQPGYSGSPLIDIDWADSDTLPNGLVITGGSATVRGVAITDFACGVLLAVRGGNTIAGNWLGVAPAGTSPSYPGFPGNSEGVCVYAKAPKVSPAAAAKARRATDDPAAMGGGRSAVDTVSAARESCVRAVTRVSTSPHAVQGATADSSCAHMAGELSLAPSGDAVPSSEAPSSVFVEATSAASVAANTIGGVTEADRNVISGNGNAVLVTSGSAPSVIEGNYIGTLADGTTADGNGCDSIFIQSASGNVIGGTTVSARNVIAADGCSAVALRAARDTVVEGNYLGLDANGDLLGNGWRGVDMWLGSSSNVIGGTGPGAGNVISGNGWEAIGISGKGTTKNTVAGNLIGTDVSGTTAVPNQLSNIAVWGGATANTIGGSTPSARNVISGSPSEGITIGGAGTSKNSVVGNFIGTDASGSSAIPNGGGIDIYGGASANIVGGLAGGAGNVISGNSSNGIGIGNNGTNQNVVVGNLVGLSASGTSALGNGSLSPSSCGGGGGIQVYDRASGTVIGGAVAAARNVVSSNGCQGIWVASASKTVIEGNYVGTSEDGTIAIPNWVGVSISSYTSPSTGSVVGGTKLGDGNLIAGNSNQGVYVYDQGAHTSSTLIAGNTIGLSATGDVLANGTNGVEIGSGPSTTQVGGITAAAGNVISGNAQTGVSIYGLGTTKTTVAGNLIGVAADGVTPAGNGHSGVAIWNGATATTVGGKAKFARNVISNNGSEGVAITDAATLGNVVSGNLIGTAADGTTPEPNAYDGVGLWDPSSEDSGPQRNTIGGNMIVFSGDAAGDGIWVDGATTTGNAILGNAISWTGTGALGIDLLDGANWGIAAPTITSATLKSGKAAVAGTAAASGYAIEVFVSSTCTTGHEQGQLYAGKATATTTGWKATVKASAGQWLTATQTDRSGDTSAFSSCFEVVGG